MRTDVRIIGYTNGDDRIAGGSLDGVKVLDWKKPRNRQLIWMDEIGHLHCKKVNGLIQLATNDIADAALAQRAAISNAHDLAASLNSLREHGRVPVPETVWLGVSRKKDSKEKSSDRGLPKWARGYEIVEEQDPCGCFAALGYSDAGVADCSFAAEFYVELLIWQFDKTAGKYVMPDLEDEDNE